jgi:hypothetical protein
MRRGLDAQFTDSGPGLVSTEPVNPRPFEDGPAPCQQKHYHRLMDGFSVPLGRQSWGAFVAAGYLPRLLARMCALAAACAPLGFELSGDRLELRLGDALAVIDLAAIDGDAEAEEVIGESILAPANALLEAAGIDPRFTLNNAGPTPSGEARGIRFGYRVTLDEGDALRSPREVVADDRIFATDPGYPAMLARYANELAAFAGVDLRAEVSPTLAERFINDREFSLQVVVRDFLHLTVRIPRDPVDVQPIFDCINRELVDTGRQLYRCMDEPWGEIAVLATAAEAAELRDQGDLLEPHHERAVLAALGRAGFQLEAMSGWWSTFATWGLDRTLLKFRELCRDEAALAWSIERLDGGGIRLRVPCQGAEEVADYGPELAEEPAADVFVDVVAQLNRALAGGEVEHRALVMTGEPLWCGRRLVLLPIDWAAQVSRYRECRSAPIDPSGRGRKPRRVETTIDAAEPPPWPIAYPRRDIDAEFPRIPELDELLPAERICDHDFKCSARPHDFYDLVVEIGELAGLDIACAGSRPGPEPGTLTLEASWRGRALPIDIVESKYLGVGPILECLNKILAEVDDPYRLHPYRAGNYEGGLVRATESELAECRRFGYVR